AEANSRGCKPPPPSSEEEIDRQRDAMRSRVIACFDALVRSGDVDGGEFSAEYVLGPEGDVLGARVRVSSVPDEAAQTCALDAIRGTRFAPPLGEDMGRPLKFGFVFASRAQLLDAAARGASSAPAPEAPPRHPCDARPADGRCLAPLVPWCDHDEKPIACCA